MRQTETVTRVTARDRATIALDDLAAELDAAGDLAGASDLRDLVRRWRL